MLFETVAVKSVFWLTLTIITVLILDNSILAISALKYELKRYTLPIFLGVVCFSVISEFLILMVFKTNLANDKRRKMSISWFIFLMAVEIILIGILFFASIQVIFMKGYSTFSIVVVSSIGIGSSILLLGILMQKLYSWIRIRTNYLVLSYAITVGIICINMFFTLINIVNQAYQVPSFVTSDRNPIVSFTQANAMYFRMYDMSSIAMFISVWISSAIMLRYYSRKIGRPKLWGLLAITLIYFVSNFQQEILVVFDDVRMNSPLLFSAIYSVVTNASRPISGILSGLALWTVAREITQPTVRSNLMLAAYGIMLLISTTQVVGVQSVPYPPFGLTTISFMPLAAYAMLSGIYYSAVYVAQDNIVKKSLRQSSQLMQQVRFLSSIGGAQADQQISNKVKDAVKRLSTKMGEESGIQINDDNMTDYLKLVLDERKKMKKHSASDVRIYLCNEKPLDESWEKWAELWWKWCYHEPRGRNPVSDMTGQLCSINQNREDVWFLAGTFGGKASRKCTIPSKSSIFFPIINDIISFAEYPTLKTEEELQNYAKADIDTTSHIDLTMDDIHLDMNHCCRVQSHVFDIEIPTPGSDVGTVRTRAVTDGYWLFLKPLKNGPHKINFKSVKKAFDNLPGNNGSSEHEKFIVEIEYYVTIV